MVTLDSVEPIQVAAPIASLIFLYVYIRFGRKHFGADDDYWNLIRKTLLPQLNRVARRRGLGYAAYKLDYDEFIGNVDMTVDEVERKLYSREFVGNPFSAYKWTPDGRDEQGSWVYRPSTLSSLQFHIILFNGKQEGTTDIYAHIEYNAINPVFALQHYLGVKYRPLGSTISAREVIHLPSTETWRIVKTAWNNQD